MAIGVRNALKNGLRDTSAGFIVIAQADGSGNG